jgi:hypothetical protein
MAAALAGEQEHAVKPYSSDPYGCRGVLRRKRETRNPQRRSHGYVFAAPELKPLLAFCGRGDGDLFEGTLPWDAWPAAAAAAASAL